MRSASSIAFLKGMRDGIPIALGYFAVSVALGITARTSGLTALQATLASGLTLASAGEYAGFQIIREDSGYLAMALMILVANARYMLMSCSLSQKLSPTTPLRHRLMLGFEITDEIFGISMAYPGQLDPHYSYGALAVAGPGWCIGTCLGVIMGNILPARIVSALSVALYGMFIAIIIPPAKKNKVLGPLIALSMGLSFLCSKLALFASLSSGTRVILLTVILSSLAALLFPVKEEKNDP